PHKQSAAEYPVAQLHSGGADGLAIPILYRRVLLGSSASPVFRSRLHCLPDRFAKFYFLMNFGGKYGGIYQSGAAPDFGLRSPLGVQTTLHFLRLRTQYPVHLLPGNPRSLTSSYSTIPFFQLLYHYFPDFRFLRYGSGRFCCGSFLFLIGCSSCRCAACSSTASIFRL